MIKAIYKNNSKKKLESQSIIKIELGCGPNKKIKDAISVDIVDLDSVDIVVDINNGLPFENNSIDEIYSFHFLEHVSDLEFVLKEIHRVLKPNGKKIVTVPHFANPYFYSDPTHNSFFGLYSFSYFDKEQKLFKRKVPTFYMSEFFEVSNIKRGFTSPFVGRYAFKKVIGFFANINSYTKEFHEENLCYLLPPYEIKFELIKIDK
ncbi:MAG: methyltransferase domain-containing protein [Draconibacterium sp.]|nr:methyltransferase domain-containing protein [Draconibacterium sp.]